MDESLWLLIPLIVMPLIVSFVFWHLRRSRSLVEQWARSEGLELVSAERRLLRRGTFWWRTARSQEVFYVTVRDQGRLGHAYLRVGSFFGGLLSDEVTVEWED
jgi:hypothetical protein